MAKVKIEKSALRMEPSPEGRSSELGQTRRVSLSLLLLGLLGLLLRLLGLGLIHDLHCLLVECFAPRQVVEPVLRESVMGKAVRDENECAAVARNGRASSRLSTHREIGGDDRRETERDDEPNDGFPVHRGRSGEEASFTDHVVVSAS